MNFNFLERYFSGPSAVGQMGAMIVLFYLMLFLVVAVLRGQVRWTRGADGNFHLYDLMFLVIKAEVVPLGFLAFGMLPFLMVASCIWNPDDTISECSRSAYYNGDCEECPSLAVYKGGSSSYRDRRIQWLPSLANAYGYGVVRFQFFVLVALVFASILGLLWLLWKIGELIVIILSPAVRFIVNQFRKIPLRL